MVQPTTEPFVLIGAVPLSSAHGMVSGHRGAGSTCKTDTVLERDVPDIEPRLAGGAGTSHLTKAGSEHDSPDLSRDVW